MNQIQTTTRSAPRICFWLAALFLSKMLPFCYAHSGLVHEKIAESAAASSEGFADFLAVNSISEHTPLTFDSNQRTPVDWLKGFFRVLNG
jgi:hypothetical protein